MAKAKSPIQIQAHVLSDTGLIRKNNEDNYLLSLEKKLFIISDGVGGESAGELASEAVVTILPLLIDQELDKSNGLTVPELLRKTISLLSQSIYQQGAARSDLKRVGATLALLWISEKQAHLAHVGDSRIYLMRNQELRCLTEDHSVVQILIKQKLLTRQDARKHPARNQLSRYIGMKEELPVDTRIMNLQNGDRFLICSDGLSNELPDEEISHLLNENPYANAACLALVNAAKRSGGKDNITVIVVNYGEKQKIVS